ncbi:MAG TPA: hypothetical protein VKN63_10005, partial [Afifellaceae bacterium]|nr:hypothetical protein [Afifellaceae bacterium]
FGVHPGCCYVGEDAGDLPADHPYHRQLLDYSSEMLGTPAGPEFYNFTNRVVTHDELHLLSEQELLRLKVATEIIPRDEGAE